MADEVVLKQEACLKESSKYDYIKKTLEELKIIDEKSDSNIEDLLK